MGITGTHEVPVAVTDPRTNVVTVVQMSVVVNDQYVIADGGL